MFKLEDRIRDWRRAVGSEGVCSAADLDELELHLREQIADLRDTGLTQEEVFVIAARRLGDIQPLTQEFAKVNPQAVFRKRLLWMCVGVLGYMLASYCATGLSKCAALLGVHLGVRGYALGLIIESIHVTLLVACLLGMLCLVKRHAYVPSLPKWLDPPRNKIMLLLGVAVVDIGLFMGPVFFTAQTARLMGVEDFGKISIVSAYVNFFLPIFALFILAALVIKLSTEHSKPVTS